jgi:hypothetical protein
VTRTHRIAGIALVASGIAIAQPPETWVFRDVTGRGDYAHVGTYLVSSGEALAAYAAHPWSREGTRELHDLTVTPSRPVGYGERFEEFLAAAYPQGRPPASSGNGCLDARATPVASPTFSRAAFPSRPTVRSAGAPLHRPVVNPSVPVA